MATIAMGAPEGRSPRTAKRKSMSWFSRAWKGRKPIKAKNARRETTPRVIHKEDLAE